MDSDLEKAFKAWPKNRSSCIQAIFYEGTYMEPSLAHGRAIIRAILDSGASPKVALWVYQSKHVRWFCDEHSGPHGGWPKTGAETYRMFSKYIRQNSNGIRDDITEQARIERAEESDLGFSTQ